MTRDWFLYVLRCDDDTLYTGITTDLNRRTKEHNAGRGARYTAGHRPVELIGAWRFPDRGAAQRAEIRFKRISRRKKLQQAARELPFEGATFYHEGTVESDARGSLRFCPRCGSLLKKVSLAGDDRVRQICTVCERINYRNAKPCAGALITREGRLLLMKRALEPFRGHWDIPGGFLEEDEPPEAGAIREAREETGLTVRPTDLLGFYVDRYGEGQREEYCLNIYFVAEVTAGQERPNREVAELAWFAPDELPQPIAFRHARQVLDDWTEWVKGNDKQRGSHRLMTSPQTSV